jgi:hypothetical protein
MCYAASRIWRNVGSIVYWIGPKQLGNFSRISYGNMAWIIIVIQAFIKGGSKVYGVQALCIGCNEEI